MADNFYKAVVQVEVIGEKEVKKELSAVDKYIEKTTKKAEALDKMKMSPAAKLKDKVSPVLDKIGKKYTALHEKIKNSKWGAIGDQMGRAFKKAGRYALTFGAVLGTLMGGITIRDTFNTFSDFGSAMSKVQAVSRASNEEIKALEAEARRLGETTEWSASQAAQAEVALSQMGFTPTQTIGALADMLSLATAGDLELGRAAEIVGGTLNAFGYSADEASRVADILALAASSSGTNVELMGESFKYAAPMAAGLGMEIEDTAAALAILGNMNIKGSQAGTTMVAMLNDLTNSSKKTKEAMEQINFSAYDETGKMKSFPKMMAEISAGLEGMTEEAKTGILQDIFGTRATRGVLSFLKQGPDAINAMVDAMENAEGTAKKMAAVMNDNLTGDIKILRSAVEEEQLKFGERLNAPIRRLIQDFTKEVPRLGAAIMPMVDNLATWLETIDVSQVVDKVASSIATAWEVAKSFGTAVIGFMKPIGQVAMFVLDTFNGLNPKTKELIGKFAGILMVLKPIAGVLGGFGGLISNATSLLGGLSGGFSSLIGLIGGGSAALLPWIGGIGLAVGAAYALYKNWDKINAAVDKGREKLAEALDVEVGFNGAELMEFGDPRAELSYYNKVKTPASNQLADAKAESRMQRSAAESTQTKAADISSLGDIPGLEGIPDEVQQIMQAANFDYDTGLQDMVQSTENRTGEMVNSFTAKREDFVAAGTDVILGLVEGIEGAAEQAVAASASVAARVAEAARANLQIHSPSGVFEDIGMRIPEGMALGIEKLKDRVVQAVSGLTNASQEEGEENRLPAYSPQAATATAGTTGAPMNFDVVVNVPQDKKEVQEIVDEATTEFGRVLLEALKDRQK